MAPDTDFGEKVGVRSVTNMRSMKIRSGFQAYRDRHSQETLVELLQEAQHRVYNLCYQVLRHSQDAEDAAQKVLLKLLHVHPQVVDEEHFKSLLVRMSFQVSLDLARSRQSRRVHEARKAMTAPKAASRDVPEPFAGLHLEISRLDAELRDLLINRYYEGKSLALIASERGCSTASVWNRLEKAKEKLRLALSGAALSALALSLESSLEAMTFTPCPKDLVSSTLSAKAAIGSAAGSTPHLPLTGGLTMAGKSAAAWATVAIFVFALLGGVSFMVMRSVKTQDPRDLVSWKSAHPSPSAVRSNLSVGAALGLSPVGARDSAEDKAESFSDHLRRFRELVRATNRGGCDNRLFLRINEESKSLRIRALADPREYFAFLRDEENQDIVEELLNVLFRQYAYEIEGGKAGRAYSSGNASDLGKEIWEGLQNLLSSGTSAQKCAVLRCYPSYDGGKSNQALQSRCIELLSEERDPALLAEALRKLHGGSPDSGSMELIINHVDRIAAILENCRNSLRSADPAAQDGMFELVSESLTALNNAEHAKAHQVIWNTAEGVVQGREYPALDLLARMLPQSFTVDSKEAGTWSALLTGELEVSTDPKIFTNLVRMCMTLPLANADPVLEHALPMAPTPQIRECIQAALAKIRDGDRNILHLLDALDAMKP